MAAQRYVHDILQQQVLPLMQRLPGPFFNKTMLGQCKTMHLSQDYLHTITSLRRPSRSPDLSPIEHIWDPLVRRVGYPTSLNELEAGLQQIWNEMSQDIIQNLHASMLDRIASYFHARGDSTGY
ncbi:transposable element Tcb1 transposase [Trichonephila clavipes]|nr:transposable element Tcb1 transposase [Trichonephila clavipes]